MIQPSLRVRSSSRVQYFMSLAAVLVMVLSSFSASSPRTSSGVVFVDAADGGSLPQYLKQLREKYEAMPDQGKFVTGAVVGYGGSKLVTKSAVTVVKVAGAAFVATELMHAMGVLDEFVTAEHRETGMNIQEKAVAYVSEIRSSIKSKFDSDNIKAWLESDRSATLGAAAGAIAGFML
eukprot:CAMPEP_0113456654 /NCGR_PEP_ID=MMETSP0014_2-20120614/9000_1 /TAXON_ID=2857 /ORGANISM="Nitzschia sp." /LENGTH=177 /DNA_ID=CAMNT_0000348117 /DNA_START=52 /DNA_END=588 /DNA_ORIENTATION=- /assembly_acc=CAM_ASM_000159